MGDYDIDVLERVRTRALSVSTKRLHCMLYGCGCILSDVRVRLGTKSTSAQHPQYGISFVRNREPGFALSRVNQLGQPGFPKCHYVRRRRHRIARCLK